MQRNKIISLFEKYGFSYNSTASKESFLAFTFKSGFFHNAEIVAIEAKNDDSEAEIESVARQLEKMGYSTKKTFYKNYEDIEKSLFDGFFNTEEWRKKIKKEYRTHCEKILSILPKGAGSYSYIKAPFTKNGHKGDGGIVEDICSSISKSGPKLIIIEAPAGFGKTCTSYEIINSLSDNINAPIPFFTEFSRDRQAKVFSHIFIREVDRSFSSVNSNVVIEEVKEGRVAVVLDGFDELLHDKSSSTDRIMNFDNAEPMLETISELLVKNSKVILTSRRSAIFDGEMFNEWLKRYDEKFTIDRYRIEKPEISDWIQSDRLQKLESVGINLEKLSNPVLLSFIRFLDFDNFENLCAQPSTIVEKYFASMLEREMERQELRMSIEQQTSLLSIVAGDMCEKNYTSDSRDKIINVIKERGSDLLDVVRSSYSPKERPTLDKLATTLSNHAFFDRSNQGDNNIEFVNEFVFGNYICENIIHVDDEWMASDERFVEPAVFSYVPRDESSKEFLWEKLSFMKEFLDSSSRMRCESLLLGNVSESTYDQCEITSLIFKDVSFFEKGSIADSVFNECTFKGVSFNFNNFDNVTFLSCSFWDCTFANNSEQTSLSFYNCKDNNGFVDSLDKVVDGDERDLSVGVDYYIFSKIWPMGSQSMERLHYFTKNLFHTDLFSRREIIAEIKKLKRNGLLEEAKDSNFIAINKAKISEIKNILGRD